MSKAPTLFADTVIADGELAPSQRRALEDVGGWLCVPEDDDWPAQLDQLGLGDLLFAPAVVGLAGELQDPQGHRDGNAVSGELAHERVEPFPGRFAWDR